MMKSIIKPIRYVNPFYYFEQYMNQTNYTNNSFTEYPVNYATNLTQY